MSALTRMRSALDEAGIYHARLVGMEFTFESGSEPRSHGLWGVVKGIKWSNEDCLELHVSIPDFMGKPLKCLTCIQTANGLVAHAHVEIDDTELKQKLSELAEDDVEEESRLRQEFNASQFIPGKLVIVKEKD